MDVLGKWKVVKVLKDIDFETGKKVYVTVDEAKELDEYKTRDSLLFFNTIFEYTTTGINLIMELTDEELKELEEKQGKKLVKVEEGYIVETMPVEIIDGKYFVIEGVNQVDNSVLKHEEKIDEEGYITFMLMFKLGRA